LRIIAPCEPEEEKAAQEIRQGKGGRADVQEEDSIVRFSGTILP